MVKNLPASIGDMRNVGSVTEWEDPLERKWHPTPVLLLEESHEQKSLADYSPWDHKESDMTK